MAGVGGPPDGDTDEDDEEAGVLELAEDLLLQGLPPPVALGVGMADEEQEEEEEEAGGWGAEVEDGMPVGVPAVTEGDGVCSVITGCWDPGASAGSGTQRNGVYRAVLTQRNGVYRAVLTQRNGEW